MELLVTDQKLPSATVRVKGVEKPIVIVGLDNIQAEKAIKFLFQNASVLNSVLNPGKKRGRKPKVHSNGNGYAQLSKESQN